MKDPEMVIPYETDEVLCHCGLPMVDCGGPELGELDGNERCEVCGDDCPRAQTDCSEPDCPFHEDDE